MKNIKRWLGTLVAVTTLLLLSACGQEEVIKIGVVGENNEVWDFVIGKLADQGVNAELVYFTEYSQPNNALIQGEIDLNSFQHNIFLDSYIEDSGGDLTPIANTVIAPLGIYSEKLTDINNLQDGAQIAIPNDATNGGRAIKLLEVAGFIEVDPEAGIMPTRDDITSNPKNLDIIPMDASQTVRAMQDVDVSIINSGMAVDAGLSLYDDGLFQEPVDERSDPYINIIVARTEDKDREVFQTIIDAYQSEDTVEVIKESSNGANIPAW